MSADEPLPLLAHLLLLASLVLVPMLVTGRHRCALQCRFWHKHCRQGAAGRFIDAHLHELVGPERPRLLERHELDVCRRQRLVCERRHQLALRGPASRSGADRARRVLLRSDVARTPMENSCRSRPDGCRPGSLRLQAELETVATHELSVIRSACSGRGPEGCLLGGSPGRGCRWRRGFAACTGSGAACPAGR